VDAAEEGAAVEVAMAIDYQVTRWQASIVWAEALGGPSAYSDSYGDETTVVKMHSGNGEHDEMDRRAIACFDQALADVGLADDRALRQALHDYFAWATTTTMSADDVPNGLSIPHWSWDGLQVQDSTADILTIVAESPCQRICRQSRN